MSDCQHNWKEGLIKKENNHLKVIVCTKCGAMGTMVLEDGSIIVHPDLTQPIGSLNV